MGIVTMSHVMVVSWIISVVPRCWSMTPRSNTLILLAGQTLVALPSVGGSDVCQVLVDLLRAGSVRTIHLLGHGAPAAYTLKTFSSMVIVGRVGPETGSTVLLHLYKQ